MTTKSDCKRIQRVIGSGMTVAQLIAELEGLNQEAHVVFASDYGDRCHTLQALPVAEIEEFDDERQRFELSAYSDSGVELADRDDEDEDDEDDDFDYVLDIGMPVVILKY